MTPWGIFLPSESVTGYLLFVRGSFSGVSRQSFSDNLDMGAAFFILLIAIPSSLLSFLMLLRL